MNTVDIIILILVFLSAIIGFWRGITREVLGITSWLLAAVCTYFLHGLAEPLVGLIISNGFFKEIVSALAVFVVALVILTSITYSFSDAVKSSIVGGADKVLGFLFGTLRGFLLISIMAFGANKFLLKNPENTPEILKSSRLIPLSDKFITMMVQSIPTTKVNEWKDKIESFFNNVSTTGSKKVSELVDRLPENMETEEDE
jgi:membrane protein required for colicin V production